MDQRRGRAAGPIGAYGRTFGLALTLMVAGQAEAQTQTQTQTETQSPAQAGTTAPPAMAGSNENLTVLGHAHRFQPAPMPGPEMGPPPDKPAPHLGRYKISGDQTKKDGYDAQTGAYIAPFGTAYTGAGPVADGLASRFQH
jgi:hypothetical protein